MRPSFRPVSPRRAVLTMMLFCAAGAALADASAPATPAEKVLPTEWKPWNGRHYRLEADGHLSCYSENSSKSKCSINAPDPAKAQPVRCNDPRWGGKKHKRTGYERADHWCNTAYANLFAEWKSYKPLGFDMQLATTPRGDVMCKSQDGTTCLPADAPAPVNPIDPLVCGNLFKQRMGGPSTGYDDPKHWCSSPEFVIQPFDKPTINAGEYPAYGFGGPSSFKSRVIMPAWKAKEAPIWLFRIKRPKASAANATLRIKLIGPEQESSSQFAVTYLNSATNNGSFFNSRRVKNDDGKAAEYLQIGTPDTPFGPFANKQVDDESGNFDVQWGTSRDLTVGYHVTPDGKVKYFQGSGWDLTRYDDIEWREGTSTGTLEGQNWLEGKGEIKVDSENWHSFKNQHRYFVYEMLFEFPEAILIKQRRIPGHE